jgi:hypothetical protein
MKVMTREWKIELGTEIVRNSTIKMCFVLEYSFFGLAHSEFVFKFCEKQIKMYLYILTYT